SVIDDELVAFLHPGKVPARDRIVHTVPNGGALALQIGKAVSRGFSLEQVRHSQSLFQTAAKKRAGPGTGRPAFQEELRCDLDHERILRAVKSPTVSAGGGWEITGAGVTSHVSVVAGIQAE